MLTSPLHALTGGRQAALFGASCSPLPLTLLGRKGECQSLGAEVLETLSGKLRAGQPLSKIWGLVANGIPMLARLPSGDKPQ